jgi:hypothetical protein
MATASVANAGVLNVAAFATAIGAQGGPAVGATSTTPPYASAYAEGIDQYARGATALATVDNSGSITVAAGADASGATSAYATAGAQGIVQQANAVGTEVVVNSVLTTLNGTTFGGHVSTYTTLTPTAAAVNFTNVGAATASITNSGSVDVAANATAVAGTAASALAYATGALQSASGTVATVSLSNTADGSISVAADAAASGTTAYAAATAVGVGQAASGTSADMSIVNAGAITASANASAVGTAGATASALALGLGQIESGATTGAVSVSNSGTLNVGAHATASGTSAYAYASAIGVAQSVDPLSLTFTNSGTVNVNAAASAIGTSGAATATAIGYYGSAFGGGTETAAIVNSNAMTVSATAIAPVTAYALAQGIVLSNAATTTVAGTPAVTSTNAQAVAGSITNSGELNVAAFASGGTITNGTGATATTTPGSSAQATGILVNSGVNNMTITNSGAINVDAVTANGGAANAYGIRIASNGDATPVAGDVVTINNSGDIVARISTDGGANYLRGTAIDVTDAPNRAVVNLLGGNIYGNIELQSDADVVNVTTGETVFNGIVNSGCMPAGGPSALLLDSAAQNDCGVGILNINAGGDLHLVIDDAEGPSYVFMDTLNLGADGTLEFDLPPVTGGDVPIGTYPQVFVDTAHVDGTVVANIAAPANGLWDTTTYQNVIDAVTMTHAGSFQCDINGLPAGSLLLSADCIFDGQNNLDIGVVRAAFDSVPGLNGNGSAVGSGLECIYDIGLTGGAADMFADLFLISDQGNYNIALNQLSGSSYANYLNSFPSLGVHYNDLTDHATNCEIPALAGSVLECRASSPIHVWGQLDYQWRKTDRDIEAGSTRGKRFTGLMGVDFNVGNAAILGVSAGYVTNHTRDRQFGDDVDADGMQVGAYAVYDPGPFFLKGVTTYSWFDGDSRRHVNFAGLATGASFAGQLTGDPDVKMWTFGLHGGARLPMGGASVVTPYLNLDYVNAKMDGFTETGLEGANLTLFNAKANRTFVTLGAKWATQMGGVVPEVNLGYRHRFGHRYSTFTGQFFDGSSATDCDFDIVSASQTRGTFLAGLSVGGKMGPVDLRIGYEGEFNGDITSHSGNFKIVLPLGGHAAPPPPAPVVAPPPPPPAPVVEQPAPPPPPPPPPPAPVERGERGQ